MTIKLFVMDVDGTLTDGKLHIGENGEIFKSFNVKDGMGVKLLRDKGIRTAIITGRESKIVENRAKEMKIDFLYQNADDKLIPLRDLLRKLEINCDQVAFIGDDLNDLSLLKCVGLKFTVKDGHEKLKENVDYVTSKNGGDGAVREAIDYLLKRDYGDEGQNEDRCNYSSEIWINKITR